MRTPAAGERERTRRDALQMIEWAIHIQNPQAVRACDGHLPTVSPQGNGMASVHRLALRLIDEYFDSLTISRVYFGNEFCQHLIPSLASVREAYGAARDRGWGFSLLTPYVTDEGLNKLRPLFEFLEIQDESVEVIFNDWGVLQQLSSFPHLKPVHGRLLDKRLRDPRITGLYKSAPISIRTAVQRSNVTTSHYLALLRRYGVELVELDNVMQGLDMDFRNTPIGAALYIPYGFVATGRVCMIASLHQPQRERFRPETRCHHECQHYVTVYTYTRPFGGDGEQRFLLKGNTHFYAHTEEMFRFVFSRFEHLGIRRFIYQPGLPMWLS